MIWNNVVLLIQIAAAFGVVCFLLPWLCLYPVLKKKDKTTMLFTCFLVSNLYIFAVVYLLGYLKIFYQPIVWVTIVILPVLLRLFFNRRQDIEFFKAEGRKIYLLVQGEYGLRLYFKRKTDCCKKYAAACLAGLFKHKLWEWLIVGGCLAFSIWYYGYRKFHSVGYTVPDEEVHLYWVQSLIGQNIFPAGMYPHGFHNLIAVLSSLFSISAVKVLMGFSHVILIVLICIAYLVCRKLFSNKYGALAALMIYCCCDFFINFSRFQHTLPMEYGMAGLFLLVYGLYVYIKDKNQNAWFLIAGSVAYTMACHFYVTIFAAGICGVFGLVYLIPILRRKCLLGLLGAGLAGLFFSVAPFGLGLILGYPFEQSMAWAVGMISESSETADTNTQEAPSEETMEEKEKEAKWAATAFPQKIKAALLQWCYSSDTILYVHVLLAAFAFVFGVLGVILGKDKNKYLLFISLSLLWCVGNLLSITYMMGWPAVIEVKRAVVFMQYMTMTLYLIPAEALWMLLRCRCKEKLCNSLACVAGIGAMSVVLASGHVRGVNLLTYWEMQTDGSMKLCMDLVEAEKDFTWTVVSPVNDRSVILNNGYHYELLDFVEELDRWKESQRITIPTPEVYFVIEKYPLIYRLLNDRKEDAWKDRTRVTRRLITQNIDGDGTKARSELYQTKRDIIMAKAYFWAKEYEKYYPNEMKVYYEDEEVVIYQLVQPRYALLNLSVDYGQEDKR